MPIVQINHALPTPDGKPPVAYDGSFKELPPGVTKRRTGESREFDIDILDGRRLETPLDLTVNGVQFVQHFEPAVDLQSNGLNSEEVIEKYYPQIAEMVCDALGSENVKQAIVFDHTIRSIERRRLGAKETNGENVGGYANGAHNDNSSDSVRARIRLLAKSKKDGGSVTFEEPLLSESEAERILTGHFGVVNVWRHFRRDYPVQDYPLALLDAASAKPEDFQIAKYIYPHRVGEVVNALHHPHHRWVYYSEMEYHEALLFKVFDNASELGLASIEESPPHTAHTSFKLPSATDNTPCRESIECRVLVEFR
ncbi:MAG: CmcJ/NvfI family oxidoreductase [Pseudomonadota bacterium]